MNNNIPVKIALVGLDSCEEISSFRYLAIEALASHLRHMFNHRVRVSLWVLGPGNLEAVINEISHFNPELLGISMPLGTVHLGEKFLTGIQQHDNNAQIIIGNLVATNAPRELSEKFSGVWLVQGEGEKTLEAIVRRWLKANYSFPGEIPGIAGFNGNGHFHTNKATKNGVFGGLVDDLWDELIAENPGGQALIEGSRGCAGKCTFCSSCNLHPYGWTPREIDDLLVEIDALYRRGVRWLFFVDDDFVGHSWERALDLSRKMARYFPELKYGSSFRADSLAQEQSADNLKKMWENGLSSVLVGIESGSPRQLRRLGKMADLKINSLAIKNLRAVPELDFTAGFVLDPLMSLEELIESVAFVQEYRLEKHINHPFSVLEVHKGSVFEKLVKKNNLQTSFDLNTITWKCRFKDNGVRMIMETTTLFDQYFTDIISRLKKEYRLLTRASLPSGQDETLKAMLSRDLNRIKVIMFKLLASLTQSAHEIDLSWHFRAGELGEALTWAQELETRYREKLPELSEAISSKLGEIQSLK